MTTNQLNYDRQRYERDVAKAQADAYRAEAETKRAAESRKKVTDWLYAFWRRG